VDRLRPSLRSGLRRSKEEKMSRQGKLELIYGAKTIDVDDYAGKKVIDILHKYAEVLKIPKDEIASNIAMWVDRIEVLKNYQLKDKDIRLEFVLCRGHVGNSAAREISQDPSSMSNDEIVLTFLGAAGKGDFGKEKNRLLWAMSDAQRQTVISILDQTVVFAREARPEESTGDILRKMIGSIYIGDCGDKLQEKMIRTLDVVRQHAFDLAEEVIIFVHENRESEEE